MKNTLYVVYHFYGEDTETTDEKEKFIGVFSSAKKAKEAINYLMTQPGFRDQPKKAFAYGKFWLNRCSCETGFVSSREANDYLIEQEKLENEKNKE